jgi:dihydroorotase
VLEANQAHVLGIKMHAIRSCVGALGMEPLRRGRAIADELKARVMVHVGETWSDEPTLPIEEIAALLRPGDVVTHMYTGQRGGLLDASGKLYPVIRDARNTGVRFDIGHGSSNLSWEVAQRLLDQDFPPDTVSTDGSHRNLHWLVYDLPTVMTKLLSVGVPLESLVRMATSQAAALIGRSDELGSLAPGRVGDVSVLRLEEHSWTAMDSRREERVLPQRLVPVLCVRAGEVSYPSEPAPAVAGH